jgi:hypothetical protein
MDGFPDELILIAASLLLVAVAGRNLRNCITNGTAVSYSQIVSRAEKPVAFWWSAVCSLLAILTGSAVLCVMFASLFGLV